MDYTYYPASNLLIHVYRVQARLGKQQRQERGAWEQLTTPMDWVDARTINDRDRLDSVLLSYHYWGPAKFDMAPDAKIFGDSGGFSVLTKGANIDPVDVIRWQIQNCTVGAILDIPPQDQPPEDCLVQTRANIRRAYDFYERAISTGSRFRWWGVIHGQTLSAMRKWYDGIASLYDFTRPGEGWCLKPQPLGDPRGIARSLYFAKQVGLTHVHLLGITSIAGLATLFVLGPEAGIKYASFDSSTAGLMAATTRTLMIPNGLGFTKIEERDGSIQAEEFMRHTCRCSSCTYLRHDYPERAPRDDSYIPMRMLYHNVLASAEVYRKLWWAADSNPGLLLRSQLSTQYGEVMRAFEGEDFNTQPQKARSLLDYL